MTRNSIDEPTTAASVANASSRSMIFQEKFFIGIGIKKWKYRENEKKYP